MALFCVRPANAALQTNTLTQGIVATGWALVYDNAQVSGVSFSGNTNWNRVAGGSDRLMGTVSLTKTFNSMSAISLFFIELTPATNDDFGLRLNLNETVINQSSMNWTGLRFDVTDTNRVYDPADQEGTSHPEYAHIHPSSMSVAPFTPSPAGGNGYRTVSLGGGIFANNTTNNWTSIAVHQYEENGKSRPFTLSETPVVPEPGTMALMLMGTLGFALRRFRRL